MSSNKSNISDTTDSDVTTVVGDRTEIQVFSDAELTTLVYDETEMEEAPYRINYEFPTDALPWACPLYMRARHRHAISGNYTPWSDVIQFSLNTPPSIVGVCLDLEAKTFRRIDGSGEPMTTFDYKVHPSYAGISMVSSGEEDGAMTLTKIPMLYVNTTASGPVGSFSEGKKCWWISDLPALGFKPHPAFKRGEEGSVDAYTYLGTYLCSKLEQNDVVTVVSRKNMEVLIDTDVDTIRSYMDNMDETYRIFDIWDLSLVKLLAIIAKGYGDTQLVWGRNTDIAEPRTGSTGCRLIFKGTINDPLVVLDDLWQNYWYYVDRIRVYHGRYIIQTPYDRMLNIDYDHTITSRFATPPETSGWIIDVADSPIMIGSDYHDLQELMIPSLVSTESSDSAFNDYFSSAIDHQSFIVGCSHSYSTIESIGYWSAYGTSCPRRITNASADLPLNSCLQSEQPCDEQECRYTVDTASNEDWETKAGLCSVRLNNLPSANIGVRISKQ